MVLDTGGEEGFAGSGDERRDYRGVPSSVDDCNAQGGTWEREGGSVSEKTTVEEELNLIRRKTYHPVLGAHPDLSSMPS